MVKEKGERKRPEEEEKKKQVLLNERPDLFKYRRPSELSLLMSRSGFYPFPFTNFTTCKKIRQTFYLIRIYETNLQQVEKLNNSDEIDAFDRHSENAVADIYFFISQFLYILYIL